MKTLASLAGLIFALALAPTRADASTVADCQAAITTLTTQTEATAFLRGDKGAKVQSQLVFHLEKASFELDQSDPQEALKQMGNYSTNLERAVRSESIAPEDAALLQTVADGVVACIQTL